MRRRVLCYLLVIAAWLGCHAGTGLVRVDSRTPAVPLYDNYFHSCQVALLNGVDSAGVATYAIALTFDEGDVSVAMGDEVTFKLRDGQTVVLHTADRTRSSDIHWRRFKNDKVKLVTVYCHITWEQLARMLETDSYSFSLKTSRNDFSRNIKDVKKILNGLYKQLNNT